ncbi:MAG TPA: response regulator [Anaeromyxobacteraceae bacterium]|nr:response regulator [Anaeromyxobacteraceae bacterium]
MSRPTLLVVDDDANLFQGLELSLRKEYRLLSAPDASTALRLLASEPVDLVLADYRMPGMDGLAFLELVRNRFPDTVRIVLTGHVSAEVAIRAMNEAEVYRFLEKPVDRNELLVTLYLAHEKLKLDREHRRLHGLMHGDPEVPAQRPVPLGRTQDAAKA